ncbi:hypothetical protein A5834_001378, partial [Enterococcus faecium]
MYITITQFNSFTNFSIGKFVFLISTILW